MWNRIFERAGIKRFQFHQNGRLRHFFGSLLIYLTGDIYCVAGQMGHKTVSTTIKNYGRRLEETKRGRRLDRAVVAKFLDAYRLSEPVRALRELQTVV